MDHTFVAPSILRDLQKKTKKVIGDTVKLGNKEPFDKEQIGIKI